jgi:Tfp pilus assembly protein PilZ
MVRLMVLVALVVPMVTSATPAHADDKTVGIGLEFGQGPGLSLKVTT